MSQESYEAGDFVSADKYVVNTPGRLLSLCCRDVPHNQCHGGILLHDAPTGLILAENQVSLGACETLMAKECFENSLQELAVIEIHHLYKDIGIFSADLFIDNCKNKFQTQSFSGVGAHHQNAFVEWSIQTIIYMAQTFMIHVSLHWIKRGDDNLALWGCAVKHAIWLHNCIPNHLSGLNYWPR